MQRVPPPVKSTPPTPPRGNSSVTPRSTSAQRPSKPIQTSAELERALALRDVMDHAVKAQREITAPKTLKKSRAGLIMAIVLCIPLLGASAYSWIARPAAIWGQGVTETPAREEANIRFAMYLVAERLESYRQAEGTYPTSLAAIGQTDSLASYQVTSDSTFELRSRAAGREIVFRSTEPVEVFLGNSMAIVTGRKR